jgi:hypothetical protein
MEIGFILLFTPMICSYSQLLMDIDQDEIHLPTIVKLELLTKNFFDRADVHQQLRE